MSDNLSGRTSAVQASEDLQRAWDFIEHTDVSVFLTGKAGTGKTTFLRDLVSRSAKTLAVVAPSGVAAINAGGVTIHSFFQLPLSPYIPGIGIREQRFNFSRDKLRIIRALDVLVIDEISMVRSDLLDAVDDVLRRIRGTQAPFGGVQLLMIGDLRQLSPIVTPQESQLLATHYDTPYFFGSQALRRLRYVTISLRHVFRQKDGEFVRILNDIRDGHPTAEDLRVLNGRLDPGFTPPPDAGYIRLTTHNRIADSVNNTCLEALPGRTYTYKAQTKGTFPETSFPTDAMLTLKVGAQVMFIKNDTTGAGRFFNGKVGRVAYLDATTVKVSFPESPEYITVEPMAWENTTYVVNPETNTLESSVQGTFSQLPLRLAWAITIHKSQGLTFDRAIIDAGASFAPGQVYVALSRCRSLEGMVLATPISAYSVIDDPAVASYIAAEDARVAESIAILPQLQSAYRVRLLCDTFRMAQIDTLHGRLCRILSDTYSKMFADITRMHLRAHEDLRTQVLDVADRWIALLSATDSAHIAEAALQDRIRRSARYFAETLGRIFGPWFEGTAMVRSDNKVMTRRLADVYEQLRVALRATEALMQAVAEGGFDPSKILAQRRRAMLEASAAPAKSRTRATKTTTRERSSDVSVAMLRRGMTIKQVAAERSLSQSTVTRHIADGIAAGQVDIYALIERPAVGEIADAIRLAGEDATLDEVRQLCIRRVPKSEIVLVRAWLSRSK